MDRALLDVLACPRCGGPLQAVETAERDGELVGGALTCECGERYPIEDGVPYLLIGAAGRARAAQLAPAEAAHALDAMELPESERVTVANIYFHNVMAPDYEQDRSTKGIFSAPCQRRIEEAITEMRSRTTGEVFLDIGCGTGNILGHAARHFRCAIGLDVSPGMLALSRSRGLRVIGAAAAALPFRPASVDAVSVFSVLHHLYDPKQVLAHIARAMKPGGVLYTDWDPNADARRRMARIEWLRVLYGRGVGVAARVGRAIGLPVRPHLHAAEQEPLVDLTEYHDKPGTGLDGEELRRELLRLGFRDVRVVCHWNSPTCRTRVGVPRELPLAERLKAFARMALTMTFDPDALAPLVLIMAQK
jgi:ubiquinone/menaquinone biosynthesis C-methylase UbiE/uncharacterized protein YbaR (Trm112 family)